MWLYSDFNPNKTRKQDRRLLTLCDAAPRARLTRYEASCNAHEQTFAVPSVLMTSTFPRRKIDAQTLWRLLAVAARSVA